MQNIKKAIIYLFFLSPLGFVGCSSDDGKDIEPVYDSNSVTIPSSNSRFPSSGVLTSEYADSPEGYGIAQATDNNWNTKFVTPHTGSYIHWAGNESVVVNYYYLISGDNDSENDPKKWSLYGSTDNSNWIVIDTRTEEIFSERKEKKEYELSNTRAFKYIKLEIESNYGGSSIQFAEISFQKIVLNIDNLMQYASGYTENSTTPMGNHYANKHITTEADRQWLATASNEPEASQAGDGLTLKEFSVRLYPTAGNPSPADANQHGIGNCCAIAVFASFAYIYPDFIKAIIKDNADNTFTVAMFDPQGEPVDVTVTSKFVADGNGTIQAVSGKNNVACWSTVLEKAIMKWNAVYRVNYNIGGIGTEHVIPLFTGNGTSFAFSQNILDNGQLAQAVTVSLKMGKFVIGGFDTANISIDGALTVTAHAWTMMHSSNSSSIFAMRNPWGGNSGSQEASKDGVINIPNDRSVTKTIDCRIMEPGKAAIYGSGISTPYTPPAFAPSIMRLSPELMRTYGISSSVYDGDE